MKENTPEVNDELARIAKSDPEGMLRPESVVKAAQSKRSALHARFQWDDTEAAREYRLEQARRIIRVAVTILPSTEEVTRCYVSLEEDRSVGGGGYRTMVSVMSDADKRAALLSMARNEMNQFRRKYNELSELSKVFAAMDKV